MDRSALLRRAREAGYLVRPVDGDGVRAHWYVLNVGRKAPDHVLARAVASLTTFREVSQAG